MTTSIFNAMGNGDKAMIIASIELVYMIQFRIVKERHWKKTSLIFFIFHHETSGIATMYFGSMSISAEEKISIADLIHLGKTHCWLLPDALQGDPAEFW